MSSAPKDWRFRDATWNDHPVYRRLMQLYLTAATEVRDSWQTLTLSSHDRARAKFLAEILTSALAPSNTLLGNPAALKRAFETSGLSIGRTLQNFLRDLRHDGGLPAQVDR